MPTRKIQKPKYIRHRPTKKKKQTKKAKDNNSQTKNFVYSLVIAKKYTETIDKFYDKYKTKSEYKSLTQKNPTLFIANMIFYDCHEKSLFHELCKSDDTEFREVLKYCFKLATIVKTKKNMEHFVIIKQLCTHGFNTIFDIILENEKSFYLASFLSHLASEGIIKNANEFLLRLSKNKIYELLRDKLVIRGLQLSDLFTRIKRYQ